MGDDHLASKIQDVQTILTDVCKSLEARDQDIRRLDEDIQKFEQQQQSKQQQDKIRTIDREIEKQKKEKEKLEKEINASKDARKMFGDTKPGDMTHEQISLEYKELFKDAFRKLPLNIKTANKYELWKMCGRIFQEAYDTCREEAVDQMIDEVSKFVYPEECSRGTEEVATGINEIKTDINRAYEILVKACQLSEAEEKEVIAKVNTSTMPVQQDIYTTASTVSCSTSQYQEDVLFAIDIAKLAIASLPPANQESSLLECFNLEDQKLKHMPHTSHRRQRTASAHMHGKRELSTHRRPHGVCNHSNCATHRTKNKKSSMKARSYSVKSEDWHMQPHETNYY